MRQRTTAWKNLAMLGEFNMQTVAVINNVEYSTITAPVIKSGLLPDKTLSVGNCIASTLEFTVMTTNEIPKSAKVVIKSRLVNDTTQTEWKEFGTYWIDKRIINDDLITLTCYDAMMMGNQPYVDTSSAVTWPKSMKAVVIRIAEQMGVEIDSRTTILPNSGNSSGTGDISQYGDYVVYKPDDTDTLLDILKCVGEIHGGNWIITPENKLRLVPLASPPVDTFNIVDDSFQYIYTSNGYRLIYNNSVNNSAVNLDLDNILHVPVVTGKITTARKYAISRVTMIKGKDEDNADTDVGYTAGNDSGYELRIPQNRSATQNLCNALYTQLNGVEYAPFEITTGIFDPAAELGDPVIAGDKVRSVVYTLEQRLDLSYTASISAPGEDEIDSEFPFMTPMQKTQYEVRGLKNETEIVKSSIVQMNDRIATKVTAGEVESIIEQKADSIRLKANEISWDSTYSSLTSDGTLTLKNGAIIEGGFEATARYDDTSVHSYDRITAKLNQGTFDIEIDNTKVMEITGDIEAPSTFIAEIKPTNSAEMKIGNSNSYIRFSNNDLTIVSNNRAGINATLTVDDSYNVPHTLTFVDGILVGFTNQ